MLSADQLASLRRWARDGKANELNLTLPEIVDVAGAQPHSYVTRRVINDADLIQNAIRELLRHLDDVEHEKSHLTRLADSANEAMNRAITARRDMNATAVLQGFVAGRVAATGHMGAMPVPSLGPALEAYAWADTMEQARGKSEEKK